MARRALMVVAKKPAPGQTKTRLCPPLSGEQAAALYEAFLRDTLDLIRAARACLPLDPILVYLPEGADEDFRALAPDFARFQQQGADLSERLNHATTHCLTRLGYNQAAIMNSDSPTLPVGCLVEAFTALEQADVTLGPTDDGGYYLIGLKRPAPPLFLTVTMSTPRVAQDTLDRAHDERLSVHLLPPSHDVDYVDDLWRLADELRDLPPHVAAHTRRFLEAHPVLLSGRA
ncbi:MAG: TIGR04282 family arsenosugar biosynthesis glycosyltransferase [Anaerolineae bacterium]|nr:TIGR04282 family arsenosugar biosynthesis glycosyltransferase [Anaerolineae bacterium]